MRLNCWLTEFYARLIESHVPQGCSSSEQTATSAWGRRLSRPRRRANENVARVSAMVEQLECRQLLTAIVVDIGGDTSQAGNKTLRDAITQANIDNSGDTITFASNLAGQTITLSHGELKITGSMTIDGTSLINGNSGILTIDGNNASRVFDVSGGPSQTVTISRLFLQHGNSTGATNGGMGGLVYNNANLSLLGDIVTASTAPGASGGGIGNDGGTLTVLNCSVTDNSADGVGGGISNAGGTVTSTYSFYGRNSTFGGAGGGIHNVGTYTSTNDTISSNTADGGGGGIYNDFSSSFTAMNDEISQNTSIGGAPGPGGAGGGGVLSWGTFIGINDTVADNTLTGAVSFAGGLDNGGTMTLVNVTVSGNIATGGAEVGGISNAGTLNAINVISVGNVQSGTPDTQVDFAGVVLSGQSAGNQIGGTLSSVLLTGGTGAAGFNPLLANNGGPTQTILLASGSPAINSAAALTTLASAINGSVTTATVTSATYLAVGELLKIDSEIVQVTDVTGTTITIQRAVNGTTAASHSAAATLFLATDQRGVSRTRNDAGAVSAPAPLTTTISSLAIASGVYTGSAFAVTNVTVVDSGNIPVAGFGDPQLSYKYYSGTLANVTGVIPLAGAPRNVGNYTVVATFTSSDSDFVSSVSAPVNFSITKAALTISAVANTKVYDGTTSAAAKPTVSGLKGSDTVTGLAEAYTLKDVKGSGGSTLSVTGKTINDGNSGNNYTVTLKTIAGTITAQTLTITAATNTKVYDATTTAAAKPTVSGLVGADTVTNLVEAYASDNVLGLNGSTLIVTGKVVNDGNSGNDYTLVLKTAVGTITPSSLTLSAVTNSKVYDGTTSAAAKPTVSGLKGTDSVTGLSEVYLLKDVKGTNLSVLDLGPTFTINDGNHENNYTLVFNTALGTITPAVLTISAITNSKVYDGTTSAAAKPTVSGLKGTDTVTNLVESYVSKNVLGANLSTLKVTGDTINDGNSGKNYTVALNSSVGTITAASLTLNAVTNTKVYDGTMSASATPTVTGLKGADTVSGLFETYTSKDVKGTNVSVLQVGPTFVVNDGNADKNYSLAPSNTAPGTITARTLTITAATNTKVYDATTTATAKPTVSGLVGTDTVTGLVEAYAVKDVKGIGLSTLKVTASTVNDGNGGKDYAVALVTAAGTITGAGLTINATVTTKVYDGTTSTTVLPTVSGLKGSDTATGLAQAFAQKDVKGLNGSPLNVISGTINDGNNQKNYIITWNSFPGTITPASLSISAATGAKVYDGTTSSTTKPTVIGLKGVDGVTGLVEVYASKDVKGTNGSVLHIAAGFVVNDGNGGKNYTTSLTNTAVGTITPATLVISAVTNTKDFDGMTTAIAKPKVLSGLMAGDTVTGLVEAYISKNANGLNGSILIVTGFIVNDGNNGNDYLVETSSAMGTIQPVLA